MKISGDLRHKIERLAASSSASAAGRPLSAFGGRSLLGAMLLEIDETVLARTLRFSNAEGREIFVDTANRRLLRLRAPNSRQIIGRPLSVLWQPDDVRDARTLDLLRDLLDGFIADSDRLQVWEEVEHADQPGDGYGISAQKLADAWGVELVAAAPSSIVSALDHALSLHHADILCWLRQGDGQTESGGDATLFARAETLSRDLARQVVAPSQTLPPFRSDRWLVALDRCEPGGSGVVQMSCGGITLTLLVRPSGLNPVLDTLQQTLHGWLRDAPNR